MIVGLLLNSYSLSTVGVDNRNFQSNLKKLKMICFLSIVRVDNWSFQSYLKPGKRYAYHQLPELTTVAFRATKILSTVRVAFTATKKN